MLHAVRASNVVVDRYLRGTELLPLQDRGFGTCTHVICLCLKAAGHDMGHYHSLSVAVTINIEQMIASVSNSTVHRILASVSPCAENRDGSEKNRRDWKNEECTYLARPQPYQA